MEDPIVGRGDTLKKKPWKPGEVATTERIRDERGRWLPGQKNLTWRCDLKRIPTENDLELIERMAAEGHGQYGICAAIPISYKTWQRWLKDYPEVKESWRRGLASEEHYLVKKLKECLEKGHFTPGIFLLKARHGYVEGEPPQTDQRVQIAVTLPGALKPDQYSPTIAVSSGKAKVLKGGDDDE
jgi:hypothetical protein